MRATETSRCEEQRERERRSVPKVFLLSVFFVRSASVPLPEKEKKRGEISLKKTKRRKFCV